MSDLLDRDAAIRAYDKLRPWLRHRPECAFIGNVEYNCTCGLDAAILQVKALPLAAPAMEPQRAVLGDDEFGCLAYVPSATVASPMPIQPIPDAYVTNGETHWCPECKAEFSGPHPANKCVNAAPVAPTAPSAWQQLTAALRQMLPTMTDSGPITQTDINTALRVVWALPAPPPDDRQA